MTQIYNDRRRTYLNFVTTILPIPFPNNFQTPRTQKVSMSRVRKQLFCVVFEKYYVSRVTSVFEKALEYEGK